MSGEVGCVRCTSAEACHSAESAACLAHAARLSHSFKIAPRIPVGRTLRNGRCIFAFSVYIAKATRRISSRCRVGSLCSMPAGNPPPSSRSNSLLPLSTTLIWLSRPGCARLLCDGSRLTGALTGEHPPIAGSNGSLFALLTRGAHRRSMPSGRWSSFSTSSPHGLAAGRHSRIVLNKSGVD